MGRNERLEKMKILIKLKSPDCLYHAAESIIWWNEDDEIDKEQTEIEKEKFKQVAQRWIEYGEYLTVEIDTEEESIRVLEV
jgi:hypothetical protein